MWQHLQTESVILESILFSWAFSRTKENQVASHHIWQYQWRNSAFTFTVKVALSGLIVSMNGGTGRILIKPADVTKLRYSRYVTEETQTFCSSPISSISMIQYGSSLEDHVAFGMEKKRGCCVYGRKDLWEGRKSLNRSEILSDLFYGALVDTPKTMVVDFF